MGTDDAGLRPAPVAIGFLAAAVVLGSAHAAVSLYWASGGQWLLGTLGQQLLDTFVGMRWVLYPVGVLELALAVLPLLFTLTRWPLPRLTWPLAWVSAVALVVWGGLNTGVGQLVLAGAVQSEGGFDHEAMVGHAWLWDPMFAVWGLCLAAGLWLSRGAAAQRRP